MLGLLILKPLLLSHPSLKLLPILQKLKVSQFIHFSSQFVSVLTVTVFSGHLFCYEAAGDCSSVCFLGSISVSINKLPGMSFTKKPGFPVLLRLSSVHWCWHLFLRGCYLFSDGWIPSEARENRDWFGILCEARCSSILVAGEEHPGFVWGAPTALCSSIASASPPPLQNDYLISKELSGPDWVTVEAFHLGNKKLENP